MKKVKIMLSIIFFLALVGGALAFKVKADNFCYYKKNGAGTRCTLANTPSTATDVGEGDQFLIVIPATGCPSTQDVADCSRAYNIETN